MLNINTNLSSLIAQNSLNQSTNKLNTAIERMSTGCKINHAKDNAANYSISTNMTTKIGAYQVAEDNALQGLDMINTASESLTLIEDKLMRLRALAEQSANGTYGTQSKQAINQEANAIVDEIERLYNTTEYNSQGVFYNSDSMYKTYSATAIAEMTSLTKAIEEGSLVAGGVYSISSADELAKLSTAVNAGLDTTNMTFVLANDIDLAVWCDTHASTGGWVPIGNASTHFRGTFDGNGNVIKNLKIERSEHLSFQALFGLTTDAKIKDLGIVNCSVIAESGSVISGLVARATTTKFSNCYVTGEIFGSGGYVGGLVGYGSNQTDIINCYSVADITGGKYTGGLVGLSMNSCLITNSFATGDVYGTEDIVGGLVGHNHTNSIISNCYATGNVYGEINVTGGLVGYNYKNSSIINSFATGDVVSEGNSTGGLVGYNYLDTTITNCARVCATGTHGDLMSLDEIEQKYTNEYMGFTSVNGWVEVNGVKALDWQKEANINNQKDLQIGVHGNQSSLVTADFGISLWGVIELRDIGKKNIDFLSKVDVLLSLVSEKQTEYGAVQNRLESVVEEIGIQYDNLVSSRSTLRDADIAEVSAEYIQQQILQQASATLLATANQSPSIALQLL